MDNMFYVLIFAALHLVQGVFGQGYLHFNANTSDVPFDRPAFLSAEPTAARELSFDRSLGARSQGPITWNWKLSVSEVALPNTTGFTTAWDTQPDSRVAYTTFELSWPQDGNVNQAVAAEYRGPSYTNESCIYHEWATLPQNVTNAWNSSSSSCRSAIGAECESYIINSMGNEPGCSVSNRQSLYSRPECAGSFGAATGETSTQSYAFGNTSGPRGDDVGFRSGDRMAWTITDSYAPGNTTEFDMAKNRLYMMIMTNSYGTQVLCNRIGDGIGSGSNVPGDDGGADNSTKDGGSGGLQHGCPRVLLLSSAALLAVGLATVL